MQLAKVVFVLLLSNCLFGHTTIEEKLYFDGLERTFITHIPPWPSRSLVLVFHYHGDSAKKMMFDLEIGLQAEADANGTILVCVDGVPNTGPNWAPGTRSWNAYHCCGNSFETHIDDVGFVSYLIDYLKNAYGVEQVFAMGFSNGGMLCHRLASELSDKIAAIAVVSGCIGGQHGMDSEVRVPAPPTEKISVIMVHGRKDTVVPFYEDWSTDIDNRLDIPFEEGVRFWRETCGYDLEQSLRTWNDMDCEIKSYKSSQSRPSIFDRYGMMTVVFRDGDHELRNWPFIVNAIWKFFENHKR